MLRALLKHKAAAQMPSDTGYTDGAFILSEDTLTAMVFGRLMYLPSEVFWSVLRGATVGRKNLPPDIGYVEDVQFWPGWRLDSNAATVFRKVRVEPDIFIRFSGLDIIVEAKRHDDTDAQYEEQLAAEWIGYHLAEPQEAERERILLAVGGLRDLRPDTVAKLQDRIDALVRKPAAASPVSLVGLSWKLLLDMLLSLDTARPRGCAADLSRHFIINDICEALQLHGIFPQRWLAEIPEEGHRWLQLRDASLTTMAEELKTDVGLIALLGMFSKLSGIDSESLEIFKVHEGFYVAERSR